MQWSLPHKTPGNPFWARGQVLLSLHRVSGTVEHLIQNGLGQELATLTSEAEIRAAKNRHVRLLKPYFQDCLMQVGATLTRPAGTENLPRTSDQLSLPHSPPRFCRFLSLCF